MSLFVTEKTCGYSVKFSPFNPCILAVASNDNYGFSGSGTLFILRVSQKGMIHKIKKYHCKNALFDVCWSDLHSNHVLTASSDGFLQVWDLDINDVPIAAFVGHDKEISHIEWKTHQHVPLILTSSWDKLIKVWDLNRTTCLTTFTGHFGAVCEVTFSPHIPNLVASVSTDKTLKVWTTLNKSCTASIQVHDAEVLSCDWCKHNGNLIVTSASDSLIRCWDIRKLTQPLYQAKGSEQAIKQIRFSPHFVYTVASASFDGSTRIWDFKQATGPLEMFQVHSGFVYGLDWNKHKIGELADCSWDKTVQLYRSKVLETLKNKI